MPVTYKIDQAKQLVRTSCTGATTLDEVLRHFAELIQDPECPERLNVLLDLIEMTSLPASAQLQHFAATRVFRTRDEGVNWLDSSMVPLD